MKIEQDVEEIKEKMDRKMEEMKEKIQGVDGKVEGMETRTKQKMDLVAADVDEVKRLMVQMFEKLGFLENTIQISSAVNYASNTFVQDILIAGGWDSDGRILKSVEKFSWKKNVWERVSSMNVSRIGASTFVYENQVFVAGGYDNPAIEVLSLNKDPPQWKISEATLPFNCNRLRSVVYQNRPVLFCACGKSDHCTELCLTAPYTCKQLCKIPEPPRGEYTVVAFEQKVLIFGGSSSDNSNPLDSVLEFDLSTRKFKVMPPLPIAVRHMAGVRWGDQAVLIGGYGKAGRSKQVLMYDSKTGHITELPSLLEKKNSCAAVISGNTIVVMGGKGETGRVRSVEAFTLGGYSWRYLPAMNDIRSGPTAIVLPAEKFH